MSDVDVSNDPHIPHPPLWPLIVYQGLAKEIIGRYNIANGLCLDVGSGVGMLGIELARRTRLNVFLLDVEKNVLAKGLRNAEYFKVRDRVSGVQADAHALPFREGSLNLIVSRGSIPFWRDIVKVFKEIYRVLAAGGVAFIGGGFPKCISKRLLKEFESRRKNFFNGPGKQYLPLEKWELDKRVREAGVAGFKVIRKGPGRWVEIVKPSNNS
ncbi:MAG: class I SAM-dependent methyltransferase [Thermoproteota archaeon]